MATKWGIAGCGLISFDFVNAFTAFKKDDPESHQVVACAARELKKAEEFAKKFDIPNAHGSYEALAKDPDAEVVYIGTINPTHLPLAKLYLDHGKHVLCEKPLAMNVKQVDEMLEYAMTKNLFLMEAMWSRFQPAHIKLKEEIEKGTLGDIYQVLVEFGINSEDDFRLRREYGGGTTIDAGIYCVNMAQWVFDSQPKKVVAAGHLNKHGIDQSVSATILYNKGGTCSFQTNMKVWTTCEAFIYGTKGKMKLKFPFWSANKLEMPDGSEVAFELPEAKYDFNYWNSAGLYYEANHVRDCLKKGLTESPVVPHSLSKTFAEVLEIIRKQAGVVYDQD